MGSNAGISFFLFLFLASCTNASATYSGDPDASRPGTSSHASDGGDLTDAERGGQAQGVGVDHATQPLIDLTQLRPLDNASEDPMPEHRPEPVVCSEDGAYIEDAQLEVNTGACNYASFSARAQRAVAARHKIAIKVSHFDLTASEPAQAHLALFAGTERMWETYVDIPRRADVIEATFEAPFAIARGTPITFHLHNHGQNTWRLLRVDVLAVMSTW